METLQSLPSVITLLIALSVAGERLVEIIKGMVPWLERDKRHPSEEARRRAVLQLMAVAAGIGISALAWPIAREILPANQNAVAATLALGLLSSGGSGFWHSILGYAVSLKDLKAATVERTRSEGDPLTRHSIPQPTEGRLAP
ncbi:MAG: hypothetical protein R2909_11875 [Gemmatimonadales bacterium]